MGAKYTYALGILQRYSYKNLSALLKLLSTNSKVVATSAIYGILLLTTSLCLSLTAEAQQPVQVLWPLNNDSEAIYSSGIAGAGFKAGPALKDFRYDSINGATASGWNSRDLNRNAYFEYTIVPERDATITLTRMKFEVSLSSVNMRTALYYSTDGFSKESLPLGNSVFVGKKSSRDLLVETSISITYPQTLTIRIYGWSAPNPAVNFFNREVEFEGFVNIQEDDKILQITNDLAKPLSENAELPDTLINEIETSIKSPLGSTTFDNSGTFVVPSWVTCIIVECWGGGAGGSNRSGASGGGGGGAYTKGIIYNPVSPVTVTVGNGGTSGNPGQSSSAAGIVANGGSSTNNSRTGGAGGAASPITGNVIASYKGGDGGDGRASTFGSNNEGGGGGGGSAYTTLIGNNGGNASTTGGSGGTGTGNGGNGADGDGSPDAVAGTAPGGGGGGRGEGTSTSKAGAKGRVIITIPDYQALFISMNIGSTSWCAGETRTISVTVQNVGQATWTNSGPDVNIGVKWDADPDYLVRTDANGLLPGATRTYFLTVTAPAAGTNHLTFDVVKEGDCWFGSNSGNCGPCNSVFTSANLTISSPLTQPSAITGSTTPCVGSSQTYSVINVPGTTYTWTAPVGWVQTGGGNSNSVTFTVGANAGNITVTPSNACGTGPSQSLSVSPVSAPSAPTANPGTNALCTQFTANWSAAANATGYFLDVSTVNSFASFVPGYNNLNVNNVTTYNVTGLTAGTTYYYRVRANNPCGPSGNSGTITYSTLPAAPAAPANIAGDLSTCTNNTETYSINPVPDATVYTWTYPAGWTYVSGQGTTSITLVAGAAGGTISVTAGNTCGTSAATSINVTVLSIPSQPGPITPATTEVCQNSVHNFMVLPPPPAGVTYTWAGPPGSAVLSGQGTNLISIRFGNQSGTLTVTPSNICGSGPSQSLNITVSTSTPVIPSAITGPIAPCAGSGKIYSVTDLGFLYTWTVPAGWTITSGQGTASITVTVGATAGNVSVIASNPCGASQPRTLSVTPQSGVPQQPSEIQGTTPVCAGSVQTYSVTNVPFVSYNWTVSGTGWAINSGNGTNTVNVTVGSSNGTLTVTPSNDCGSGTPRSKIITVDIAPPASTGSITGPDNPCQASIQTYSVINVPGISYAWTVPGDWTINSGQGSNSIQVTVGTSVGNIVVVPSNGCGNGPASSKPVTVFLLPFSPGPVSGPTEICEGSTVIYSVTNTPGVNYNWTLPGDWTLTGGQGTNAITVIAGKNPGTIVVVPTNTCGNGPASTLDVKVNPLPAAFTIEDGDICVGASVFIGGPAVPGNSYSWTSDPSGFLSTESNPEVSPTTTTTYYLVETNNTTGCTNSNSVTIQANQVIVLTVNPTTQTICTGQNATIIVTSNIIGTVFSWSATLTSGSSTTFNTGGTSGLINENIINNSNAPSEVTYQISAKADECENNNASAIVTINPAPANNNQGPVQICSDVASGVTLGASTNGLPINSYNIISINPGGLTASAGAPATGTGYNANVIADDAWTNTTLNPVNVVYTVQGVSNAGCIGNTFTVTLTVNPEPTITTSSGKGICSGNSTGINLTSSVPSSFTWTIGTITGGITGASAGSGNVINQVLINPSNSAAGTVQYIVVPSSTGGSCQGNPFTITVTVYPGPVITNPSTVHTCSGSSPEIVLAASTASNFSWTVGAITGGITGATAGSGPVIDQVLTNPVNTTSGTVEYLVTATSATGGCSSAPYKITVIVDPIPLVTVGASPTSICPGETIDLSSSSSLTWPHTIVFSENFNAATNSWTTTNNSTGGTPADAAWTLRNSGYQWINGINTVTFRSNDNSQFYLTNSEDQGGNNSAVTDTYLTSPAIDFTGYTSLSLDFYHYYRDDNRSTARVEISTNNGVTWTQIDLFSSNQGTSTNFAHRTLDLTPYTNNPAVRIRFHYYGTRVEWYWAVDNVTITGTHISSIPIINWTSNPPGFSSSEASINDVLQGETTAYTVTYTNPVSGCSAGNTVTVTTLTPPDAQITADYCAVPGKIRLTATGGGTYLWNTGQTTAVIEVDIAGQYSCEVTGINGCKSTASIGVSHELVVNGDFSAGNTGFTSGYVYDPTANGLYAPESEYAVNDDANFNHTNFWGYDHTTGDGNYMIINGAKYAPQPFVWRQTVAVTPNTDYYFSAWAKSLNNVPPFARLQFQVNGVQVGTVATLQAGVNNDNNPWLTSGRFYGSWNSGAATTAIIQIIDLETAAGGNDFGLDDISFGTLDPVPFTISPSVAGGSASVCETSDVQLLANIVGGLRPYNTLWTGPNGFTSNLENPVISNVTMAAAGTYTVTVSDSYGCDPISETIELTVIPAPQATISGGGNYCQFSGQPLIYLTAVGGTPPFTFEYNINGGATQTATTWGSDNYTILFAPTNVTGTFVYTITSVTDGNGCTRSVNVSDQVVINPLPSAYITGDLTVCPNTINNYQANGGMDIYDWSITGNGEIQGPANQLTANVLSGKDCGSPFTLLLVVTDANTCKATAEHTVLVDDTQDPVIDCQVTGTQTVQVNSGSVYVHSGTSWDATATDNCNVASIIATLSGASSGTYTSLAGVQFNQGTTTVTWTATDDCGNTASCTFNVIVEGTADLEIVKTGAAAITAGETITYTLTVTNNGPATAPLVTVTDNVPASISNVEYSTDNGTTWAAWTNTWSINNVANGSAITILIRGKVACATTGNITNTATVALGTLTDPDLTDNTSSVTTIIQNALNIGVTVYASECDNQGFINTTVTGGTSPYTYLWTTPDGVIPPGQETQEDLTGINTGTYHLVVTDANGCQKEEEWTIVSEDIKPPTFIVPTAPTFCVVDIFSALYNGLPEPNADIEPEPVYQPQFPIGWTRPDWYIIDGTTELDLTGINDNCCLPQDCTIEWTITFSNGFLPISGTGQPSTYGPIKLWGSPNYTEVTHTITYIVTDCSNNASSPIEVDIIIKPRPNVTKQ